jgi:hypothetical protein
MIKQDRTELEVAAAIGVRDKSRALLRNSIFSLAERIAPAAPLISLLGTKRT